MNKLSLQQRSSIIRLLVEGNSLRSCSRITDISITTISKLLVDVGQACQQFHNDTVINLNSTRIEADEVWSYTFCKDKNVPKCTKEDHKGIGDTWTWTALDADSKLMVSWLVGDRSMENAIAFMQDLDSRIKNRVQLSTDGFKYYITAVQQAFDWAVDYAQIIKNYAALDAADSTERKYSQPDCISIQKKYICGNPVESLISTSYVERQNLTMRMHMRRFTRLTNAFSKKFENHCHAIALHFVYYNFCKVHTTLRVTPAMEAKLTAKPMTIDDIVRMAYAHETEAENKRLARKNRSL